MINFPEINEKKIKTWSLIGSRATFGMVMLIYQILYQN